MEAALLAESRRTEDDNDDQEMEEEEEEGEEEKRGRDDVFHVRLRGGRKGEGGRGMRDGGREEKVSACKLRCVGGCRAICSPACFEPPHLCTTPPKTVDGPFENVELVVWVRDSSKV